MRVNLITRPFQSKTGKRGGPLSLTIRPACGYPGEFQFPINSHALLRLLRHNSGVSASALERFEGKLKGTVEAKLLGVELSEKVLTEIGYFVD
jgi:hypothetical protein